MKTLNMLAAALLALSAGLAQAKLPVVPMDDAAKAAAEAKKAQAAAAAKKGAEALAKAQDRAVENYRKNHDKSGKPGQAKK